MEIIKYYKESSNTVSGTTITTVLTTEGLFLLLEGRSEVFNEFEGELIEEDKKLAPTNHSNRLVLNKYFDYTIPRAFGTEISTMGLGDRLGLAGYGQLQAIANKKIRPVLAQQSIRELNLTERTFEDVLDAAAFSVYQAGYKKGYGADGDHLKLEKDIEYAIGVGMSMLTLDCSDYIDNKVPEMSLDELEEAYLEITSESERQSYEETYLNKEFDVEGQKINFNREHLLYNVVQYHKAIEYMIYIYNTYVKSVDRQIDFEISIDETMTVTSPESHFFVANELFNHQVAVTSLAPRFVGEFQKGIDYIGNVEEFEKDFEVHAKIAQHFGYKVSVHSGSDKFSVFPSVAKHTNGLFHVKTAGTNWLEALRLVAMKNAKLFIHSSFKEGFGMVIVEAMIVNGIVISTDCPVGPREILENGKSGILVEIQNKEQMAQKIMECLIDENLRKKLKNNSLYQVENFSKTKALIEVEKLFNNS